MLNKNRRNLPPPTLFLQRAALGVALVVGSAAPAGARPYEFLFTPDGVVSLQNGVRIVPGAQIDEPTLTALLPGYTIERGVEEESTVWYVFQRRDENNYPVGGLSIYMQYEDAKTVHFIVGYVGAIDAAGATVGLPLTDIYSSDTARCEAGLWYSCQSPIAPNISYEVDGSTCSEFVKWPSYSNDGKMTDIERCMVVEAIHLDQR